MQKLAVLGSILGLTLGCTHLPQTGVALHAPSTVPGSGPVAGPPAWTDAQCSSNEVAQDVWGGISIGGTTISGVTGITSVQWASDEGQRNARFAAVIGAAIGVISTLVSNNVKNRGAEHCAVSAPSP